MCCWFAIFALFGPRVFAVMLWLFRPIYFNSVFDSFLWPLLGIVFVPWTTVAYIFTAANGLNGFDWLVIGLGVMADVASYTGSIYGNRDRIMDLS